VCIHIYTYAFEYIFSYKRTYIHIHAYLYAFIHVRMQTCIHTYTYIGSHRGINVDQHSKPRYNTLYGIFICFMVLSVDLN
jgi:hypothetical protein